VPIQCCQPHHSRQSLLLMLAFDGLGLEVIIAVRSLETESELLP